MITPSTLVATILPCVMRKSPPDFSPPSTSIGIVSLVFAKTALSLASWSKLRNTSMPAFIAPGCAYFCA